MRWNDASLWADESFKSWSLQKQLTWQQFLISLFVHEFRAELGRLEHWCSVRKERSAADKVWKYVVISCLVMPCPNRQTKPAQVQRLTLATIMDQEVSEKLSWHWDRYVFRISVNHCLSLVLILLRLPLWASVPRSWRLWHALLRHVSWEFCPYIFALFIQEVKWLSQKKMCRSIKEHYFLLCF